MKNKRRAEALIIAEITGSINSCERYELNLWRGRCKEVRDLSSEMHSSLDRESAEMMASRTTAAEIIGKGNQQLARQVKPGKTLSS